VTAVDSSFAVRVMVTDVWDHVTLAVTPKTTVAEVKREALSHALRRVPDDLDAYLVKFHGGLVADESASLASLGARANAPFIIMSARRQPVR
jgi:hypothetical protein